MLFAITWAVDNRSEVAQKRTQQLFEQWDIPNGVDFQGFWDYSDGTGGLALVETDSASLLMETMIPWAAFLKFDVRPIVAIEEASAITKKGIAWRDSVG